MKRWLLGWLFGPRCDAKGCCSPGTFQTLPVPPGWSRGFRWCADHRDDASEAIGLTPKRKAAP